MARGYVIFSETTRDGDRFAAYVDKAVPTVLESGGKPIIFHEGPEVLEGKWPGARVVVLEFDSVEAARTWYTSPRLPGGHRRAPCLGRCRCRSRCRRRVARRLSQADE